MTEKNVKKKQLEIRIQRIIREVLRKSWLVLIVALLGAVLTLGVTVHLVTPMYESSAMFYVNNSKVTVGGTSLSISSGDIIASKELVNSYIVILQTRTALNEVIDYAGVDLKYDQLLDMITASAVDNTEVFRVTVTSPDPEEAEKLANAIAMLLPDRIKDVIEGSSAKIVDHAVVPPAPSSPNYVVNTLLGFVAGFVLCVAVIALSKILDTVIRSELDISENMDIPILAAVPDANASSKSSYYYGSSGKNKKQKNNQPGSRTPGLVGGDVSFAASEAYKLLRTKLQFSFADENDCHVIGVSSSIAGEGKTTSAANLAYSLAQLDQRVLLIECDLRRPTLSAKLPIEKIPGLTNYLTRQVPLEEVIQNCSLDDSCSFHAIASGRIPPNPIELLSSARMKATLEKLKAFYDYIIVDLPPVGVVSDALVAAKLVDGMLLVVRQNRCDRVSLENTIRQFEFVNARLLGILITCVGGNGISKKYYKSYYSKYKESDAVPTQHHDAAKSLLHDKK